MWSPKPARVLFKCLLGRNERIFDQYYQPECEILFDKSANQGLANNNNNIIVSPSLLNNMNDCFLNKLHSFHRLLPCLQSSVCGTRAPALFDSDLFKKKKTFLCEVVVVSLHRPSTAHQGHHVHRYHT